MSTSSVHTQELALRNAYAQGDAERCAAHHLNLANHLEYSGAEPAIVIAHRLAGGVICFQTGSDLLMAVLGDVAMSFVQFAPRQPPLPDTFDDLRRIVEQVQGVRLAELVASLAQDGGADGDEALHAVTGMARSMAG